MRRKPARGHSQVHGPEVLERKVDRFDPGAGYKSSGRLLGRPDGVRIYKRGAPLSGGLYVVHKERKTLPLKFNMREDVPNVVANMIYRMLASDPSSRPTAEEARRMFVLDTESPRHGSPISSASARSLHRLSK